MTNIQLTPKQQEYFEQEKLSPEGYFINEDIWNGQRMSEDGQTWFMAIDQDGQEYQTIEVPTRYPLFTLTQFVGSWTEEQIKKIDRYN